MFAISTTLIMESLHHTPLPPFLSIPRELRDEIFSYLVLPEHVYTSTSQPNAQSLHRSSKKIETYIDTRIYVPARAPSNILSVCRQLREDFLDHISRLANALTLPSIPNTKPVEENESNVLAARANQSDEDIAERSRDNDTVRITMEIERPMRGDFGYFTPVRDTISPRLASMAFLLHRLQRVKFVVWGGIAWWDGPPKVSRKSTGQRGTFSRVHSDQTDEQRATQSVESFISVSTEYEVKPDPLTVSMDKLLKLMPNVQEVDIDVLIHSREYLNWNLPEVVHEGIAGWLGSSISLEGRKFMRVDRRLIVSMVMDRVATFYRRLEERKHDAGVHGNTVHISEGESVVSVGEIVGSCSFADHNR